MWWASVGRHVCFSLPFPPSLPPRLAKRRYGDGEQLSRRPTLLLRLPSCLSTQHGPGQTERRVSVPTHLTFEPSHVVEFKVHLVMHACNVLAVMHTLPLNYGAPPWQPLLSSANSYCRLYVHVYIILFNGLILPSLFGRIFSAHLSTLSKGLTPTHRSLQISPVSTH